MKCSSYSDEFTLLASFLLQSNVHSTMKTLETFIPRQTCPNEKNKKEGNWQSLIYLSLEHGEH